MKGNLDLKFKISSGQIAFRGLPATITEENYIKG